jgi:hypothetical protein
MHHAGEHVGRVLSSEIDDVSSKPAGFDLGGVNSNDGDILGVLLLLGASTDDDGGRKDNVAQSTAGVGGPVRGELPFEVGESLNLRLRFLHQTLGILPHRNSRSVFPTRHVVHSLLLVIDDVGLRVDLVLNRDEVLLEGRFAQEKDIVAWLTLRPALEEIEGRQRI